MGSHIRLAQVIAIDIFVVAYATVLAAIDVAGGLRRRAR